jgi:hypothetical protein
MRLHLERDANQIGERRVTDIDTRAIDFHANVEFSGSGHRPRHGRDGLDGCDLEGGLRVKERTQENKQ